MGRGGLEGGPLPQSGEAAAGGLGVSSGLYTTFFFSSLGYLGLGISSIFVSPLIIVACVTVFDVSNIFIQVKAVIISPNANIILTMAVIVLFEIIIAINVNMLEYAIMFTNIDPINISNFELAIVIPPNNGIPIITTITTNKIYEYKLVIVVIIKLDKYILILL